MALAICFAFAPFARADARVTLCQSDRQSGSGTNLYQALLAAPTTDQFNKITFDCKGAATIQITGELEIKQPTFIDGGRNITLDGGGNHNMFVSAQSSTPLFLANLTLRNAKFACPPPAPGPPSCWGGVATGMSLVLNHCQIENSGIAIYAIPGSALEVGNTQFLGSSITSASTQTTISNSSFQVGSRIIASGTVSISRTTFLSAETSTLQVPCTLSIDRSTFQQIAAAGALFIGCGSTTISNSLFADNTGSVGGAIFFANTALDINLRAVRFLGNTATGDGGAIALQHTINADRKVVISYSKFAANKAASGGAIAVLPPAQPGTTSISARVVDFSHNVAAEDGGAIRGLDAGLAIARGIFADNKAGRTGGAIFVSNAAQIHSVFANTLIVRNTAFAGGAFSGNDAEFINSTVDSNQGIAIVLSIVSQHTPAHIGFKNSIVSNNPQGGCAPASGGWFDDDTPKRNLQFPGADCGASIQVANPHLDTMYIPLPKSLPMGNGDVGVCTSPPVNGRDVYGVGRPSGGVCTIGAAEGDIQVLVSRRPREGPKGACDCGLSLLRQLQRFLPFSR